MCVKEILCRAERRLVHLRETATEYKFGRQRVRQFADVVPLHIQAAAFRRAVVRESCDYEVPAGFQRPLQILNVKSAVVRIS